MTYRQRGKAKSPEPGGEGRLTALSDGVFAIAITLLVLDIQLPVLSPEPSGQEFAEALWAIGSSFTGYVLSFAVIGYYWTVHRRLFKVIKSIDTTLVVLNLVMLAVISFIPFPTSVLAEYAPSGPAVAFYAGVLALAGLCQMAMILYPWRSEYMDGELPSRNIWEVTLRTSVAPIVFILSMVVSLVDGMTAILSWIILIPVGRIIITYWFDRKVEELLDSD